MVEVEDWEVFHEMVSPKKWQESNACDIATNWLPEQDLNNPRANGHDNVEGGIFMDPTPCLRTTGDEW